MGLFNFGKRKKKELPPLDLPRFDQGMKDLPPLPELPSELEPQMPDLPPLPEMPEPREEERFVFAPEEYEEMPQPAKPMSLPPAPKFETYHAPEEEEHELLTFTPERKEEGPKFVDVGELFVRSDDYVEIMRNIKTIRAKINESDKNFMNIKEIKTQSEKELARMRDMVEDINKKLNYIDRTVFGG